MNTNTATLADSLRDQATSVFEYLAELSRLRTKNIRDVDRYQAVYWFDDLPHEDGCHTVAWGQTEDQADDAWVEIRKRPEPKCPPPPQVCQDWVHDSSLFNSDKTPELRDRIVVRKPPPSDTDDFVEVHSQEPEFAYLSEHPEVQKAWQSYLLHRWQPWAEDHLRWKDVQESYSALFAIHQELQRLGEQYELVLGLGYLTWRTPSDQTIKRHLIVAQAALEFEAAQGIFTLRAGAEGAKVTLETDMLLPGERPSADQQRAVEDALKAAVESPWDKGTVIPALRAWVQSLDDKGEFEHSLARHEATTNAPRVTFAPALILRRRTGRTVLAALEKIINSLKSGDDIPPEILRLVSDADVFAEHIDREDLPGKGERRSSTPEPIYFPLPANEEQRRIVENLQRRRGVLVQGPPGTGKSHTIANLICHLLATGKRVLVTAQTPRALRVLHDKLPEEIAPLCVSVLGNDRAALLNLEKCVSSISNRFANWNAKRNHTEIENLEQELNKAKKRRAKTEAELRSIREQETRVHEIASGTYRGTAQRIAQQLAEETQRFDWLRDEIDPSEELPFGPSTFKALRDAIVEIDSNRCAELRQNYPSPDSILSTEEFLSYVQKERRATETVQRFSHARERPHFIALSSAPLERVAGGCIPKKVAVMRPSATGGSARTRPRFG